MNEPSIVSSSDMPAAKRTGRQRIAYHGRPDPAAPAARKSSATSVAVSKPRPNRIPSGYICHGARIARVKRPSTRFMSPRDWSCASSSASS